MKLLKTHTLTFSIPSESTLDLDGVWTEGVSTEQIVKGSLQAFRRGKTTLILPDKLKTSDSRLFYTATEIEVIANPPTTVINGKTFVLYDHEPNIGFGLKTDHHTYLLIKQDKLTPGGEY